MLFRTAGGLYISDLYFSHISKNIKCNCKIILKFSSVLIRCNKSKNKILPKKLEILQFFDFFQPICQKWTRRTPTNVYWVKQKFRDILESIKKSLKKIWVLILFQFFWKIFDICFKNSIFKLILAVFWHHLSKKAMAGQPEDDIWLSKNSGELQSSIKKTY